MGNLLTSPEPVEPRKIPILLVVRPAEGGIRTHVIELIRRVDRAQFSLTVAAPQAFLANLPPDLPEYASCSLPLLAKTSPNDLICASRIAGVAGRTRFVVHAHGMRASFVSALARKIADFPLVVTLHNIPPRGRVEHVAVNFVRSSADVLVTVSEAIADGVGGATVIPNGVDLTHFAGLDRSSARLRLNLSESEFVVGCVARLSPEKGVDLLLRAAAMLPNIKFIVAGDGPQRNRLTASAPANVRMLGHVPDTRLIYAASDIIAIPSRSEGQGIVALEAMASGTAVVASNVGGLTETIENNKTGLLFAPENPSALAAAISALSDGSLRGELAANALAWIQQNGDIDLRVRQIEDVYERIAESPFPQPLSHRNRKGEKKEDNR